MPAGIPRINEDVTDYGIRKKLSDFVIPLTRGKAHDRRYRMHERRDIAMSAPASVYLAEPVPSAVSTLKWISIRLVLPIVICGTIAAGLQTTIAEGPKLAAANLPQLARLTPDVTPDAAEPVAPRQSARPAHGPGHGPGQGPGDARHQAAAAMLLLLVATAKSKRHGGEAQRQAATADMPVGRQTADAHQLR